MSQETLYAFFGTLGTMLLALNAYFVKGLWETLTKVDKTVAVNAAENKHLTARMDGAEKDIRLLRESERTTREGIHDLRNELGQRIQAIELQTKQ